MIPTNRLSGQIYFTIFGYVQRYLLKLLVGLLEKIFRFCFTSFSPYKLKNERREHWDHPSWIHCAVLYSLKCPAICFMWWRIEVYRHGYLSEFIWDKRLSSTSKLLLEAKILQYRHLQSPLLSNRIFKMLA